MYLDRILNGSKYGGLDNKPLNVIPKLICTNCQELIGVPYVYEKENRLAYRLFVGAISKKITKNR